MKTVLIAAFVVLSGCATVAPTSLRGETLSLCVGQLKGNEIVPFTCADPMLGVGPCKVDLQSSPQTGNKPGRDDLSVTCILQ